MSTPPSAAGPWPTRKMIQADDIQADLRRHLFTAACDWVAGTGPDMLAIDRIRDEHGITVRLGQRVVYREQSGTIVGVEDMNILVVLDEDDNECCWVCHPVHSHLVYSDDPSTDICLRPECDCPSCGHPPGDPEETQR